MTTQTSISLELLCLMRWLLENDQKALESMVKRALENGFAQELQNIDASEADEAMHTVLFDLFDFLDACLLEHLSEVKMDSKVQERIVPMLQKLEGRNIDIKTLWLSMQQTKSKMQEQKENKMENKQPDAQEVLVTQLLKNWKPNNSEPVN